MASRRSPIERELRRAFALTVRGLKFLLKFLLKHPALVPAIALGITAGHYTGVWLGTRWHVDIVVAVIVGVLVADGKNLLGMRYGAVYLAEVYHPTKGREICGYVGKTRQKPTERWKQHEKGSWYEGRWNPPQPWADTIIQWRVIHESKYMTTLGLHLREKWNIIIRRPIYNYMMNLQNPRRIPKPTAIAQRAERDEGLYTRQYLQRAVRAAA